MIKSDYKIGAPYNGIYIEPTKRLLRLSNGEAEIPKDLFQLVYIKLVGKLKNRSNWRQLQNVSIRDEYMRNSYFNEHGNEEDIEAIYGYFVITDKHICVPNKLKAKAIIICYVTENAVKAYEFMNFKAN